MEVTDQGRSRIPICITVLLKVKLEIITKVELGSEDCDSSDGVKTPPESSLTL